MVEGVLEGVAMVEEGVGEAVTVEGIIGKVTCGASHNSVAGMMRPACHTHT